MGRLKQDLQLAGMFALSAVLLSCAALLALPTTAGAATAGGLKQLTNASGCLVDEVSTPSGCQDVRAMEATGDVVVTPNGANVYVTSTGKDAIVAFDRNPATGELTQKAGITGCYTSDAGVATTDSCNLVPIGEGLDGPTAIAVSPGGEQVYAVTTSGRLTGFNRLADGSLTLNNTYNYCAGGALNAVTVSPDGASVYLGGACAGGAVGHYKRNPAAGSLEFIQCHGGACGTAQNLVSPTDLEVTPDGKELLISSANDVVLGWDRGPSGSLTPSSTPSRCVSNTTLTGTCQSRPGVIGPQSLALTENGTRIRVGSLQSLATINRDPATNNLTPDTEGNCFSYPTSAFSGCAPTPGTNCCSTFFPAREVLASADGSSLYLGTEAASAAIFGFSLANGGLTQKPSPPGCVSVGAADGCGTFRQGNRIQAMTATLDNRHVYAVGDNRLFGFEIDRAPVCQNVSTSTTNNLSVTVDLSCSDPDGDPLTFEKVTEPARGTLAGIQGNRVSYGPQPGTSGADSFLYRAVAAGVPSDPATATINVTFPPSVVPIKKPLKCKKGFVKKTVKIRRHGKVVKGKNGKAKTKTVCIKKKKHRRKR